jgi:hypothetical protein
VAHALVRRTRACRVDTRVDAWWLHLTPFAACRNVVQDIAFVVMPRWSTLLDRPKKQGAGEVLHPFKLFSACEDFEPAFQPATPALLPALRAASYSRFSPILGCGSAALWASPFRPAPPF